MNYADEELIHTTLDAPWLPKGSRAEVIRSTVAPRPTNMVRLLIRRGATVYCVPRDRTGALDLPTRIVPPSDPEGVATAIQLAREVLGEMSVVTLVGFVRNVVGQPASDYEWPTPLAHFCLWAADGSPTGHGTWVSTDDSASPLADRHWFQLVAAPG
jgi:hypothetical protein